jgi:putative transposase
MNKRNQYTSEFKTKIVLEVLREEITVHEIAAKYDVNPVMVSRWKAEFLERVPDVFRRGVSSAEKELGAEKERVAQLERKIGQLTYEVDWLKKKSEEINKRKRP